MHELLPVKYGSKFLVHVVGINKKDIQPKNQLSKRIKQGCQIDQVETLEYLETMGVCVTTYGKEVRINYFERIEHSRKFDILPKVTY